MTRKRETSINFPLLIKNAQKLILREIGMRENWIREKIRVEMKVCFFMNLSLIPIHIDTYNVD